MGVNRRYTLLTSVPCTPAVLFLEVHLGADLGEPKVGHLGGEVLRHQDVGALPKSTARQRRVRYSTVTLQKCCRQSCYSGHVL